MELRVSIIEGKKKWFIAEKTFDENPKWVLNPDGKMEEIKPV
jgi:hypothetical protein